MGWTFYTDGYVKSHAEERAEIDKLCTFETKDGHRSRMIKAAKVGTTWYAAVKRDRTDETPIEDSAYITEDEGSIVFAAVFLTGYNDGSWGYKDMTETMGPTEARAPASILALLSKVKDPDSFAHSWRERCQEWASIPAYGKGDRIKLAKAVELTDGSSCQEVEVAHYQAGQQQRRCYRIIGTGQHVRLSKETLMGSELITPAVSKGSDVLAEFFSKHQGK